MSPSIQQQQQSSNFNSNNNKQYQQYSYKPQQKQNMEIKIPIQLIGPLPGQTNFGPVDFFYFNLNFKKGYFEFLNLVKPPLEKYKIITIGLVFVSAKILRTKFYGLF